MRRVPKHIEDAFYEGRRPTDVPFCINDAVEIVAGLHAGLGGAVISIETLEPEMMLLVELGGTGGDVILPASTLRILESE